jgi:hypothetical protein
LRDRSAFGLGPREKKLRIHDVKGMFKVMKDHAYVQISPQLRMIEVRAFNILV